MKSPEIVSLKLEIIKMVMEYVNPLYDRMKLVETHIVNDIINCDLSDSKGKVKFKIDLDKIIEKEKEPWRADKHDIYWYISSDNKVRYKVESIETGEDLTLNYWKNQDHALSSREKLINANRLLFGNYFKTKQQAEEAAKAVKEVLKQKRKEFGLD